jgi:hypothetical protein
VDQVAVLKRACGNLLVAYFYRGGEPTKKVSLVAIMLGLLFVFGVVCSADIYEAARKGDVAGAPNSTQRMTME